MKGKRKGETMANIPAPTKGRDYSRAVSSIEGYSGDRRPGRVAELDGKRLSYDDKD